MSTTGNILVRHVEQHTVPTKETKSKCEFVMALLPDT